MSKTNKIKTLPDDVLTLEVPLVVAEEQKENNNAIYVVVRNGVRVSDKDYVSPEDIRAVAEKRFWKDIISRWPDGTKIEIVMFDKRKHRIW